MTDLDPRRLRQTLIRLAREDLAVFVAGAFRQLRDEPYLRNWHVEAIAHQLMGAVAGDHRRLIITIPPRTMKSFIASVCLPAWLLGRSPGMRIICASYAQDLSSDFAYEMRKLMQTPWYRQVFPGTHLDPKRSAVDEIRTTRGGYRLSTSTGGTLTGRGGDVIIIDDPIKAKDAHSDTVRESAWKWFTGTVLSRLNNQKKGVIIVVAQRLHMEDLPGRLLATEGWHELCLPIVAWQDQEIEIAKGRLAHRPAGHTLHDQRFGPEEIRRLREEMGERDFEAQYNQRPLPPGGALFKLEWLARYGEPPPVHQVEAVLQSWDTAYDIEEQHDYSVCSTWALSGKRYYLLDIYRARLEFPDLEKAVYKLREKWKAELVILEKAGAGISLYQNIRRGNRNLWAVCLSPLGSKQDRASQQSPKFERGEVYVPNKALWLEAFLSELASFPHGKHDDQVDSVVQLLAAIESAGFCSALHAARRC
jgi:predicted phage terminase large subunit-like protein